MHHSPLEGIRCEPRYSPEEARFRGLRQRLQSAAARGDQFVWVNGERITQEDFQFMLNCIQQPKPTKN